MLRRVRELVSLNALSRAANVLCRNGRAVLSEAVVAKLTALFPTEGTTTPRITVGRPLGIVPRMVHKAVKSKLARGAAPGLDGWTRELLVPIVEDQQLLNELTELVVDIMANDIDQMSTRILLASPLIAIAKQDGPSDAVRPIGPESCILKLASEVAILSLPAPAKKYFTIQGGVWGNVEGAAIAARERLHTAKRGVTIDATNAYNTIDRRAIVTAALENEHLWRPCLGLLKMMMENCPEMIVYEQELLWTTIFSKTGVKQGSVLGPLFFAIATEKILREVAANFPELKFTAYLDDVLITGESETQLRRAFAEVKRKFGEVGMAVNAKSQRLFAPGAEFDCPGTTCAGSSIVKILGAMMSASPDVDVADAVLCRIKRHDRLFETLKSAEALNANIRFGVLRASGHPRMNFLARVHPEREAAAAAEHFDRQVAETFERICAISAGELDNSSKLQVALPTRLAGLGLRKYAEIIRFAHDAAKQGVKGEQRTRQRRADQEKFACLRTSVLTDFGRRLLVAATAPMASRLFTDATLEVSSAAFRLAVRIRLNIRVCLGKCVCGADASNQHVLACARLRNKPRQTRHDLLTAAHSDMLRHCSIEHLVEPSCRRDPQRRNRQRPDVLTATTCWDWAVTSPGVKHVPAAASIALAAAQRTVEAKRAHYANYIAAHGLRFIPMVVEATGGMHPEAIAHLKDLAGGEDHPLVIRSTFDLFTGSVAATLAAGNLFVFNAARGLAIPGGGSSSTFR